MAVQKHLSHTVILRGEMPPPPHPELGRNIILNTLYWTMLTWPTLQFLWYWSINKERNGNCYIPLKNNIGQGSTAFVKIITRNTILHITLNHSTECICKGNFHCVFYLIFTLALVYTEVEINSITKTIKTESCWRRQSSFFIFSL